MDKLNSILVVVDQDVHAGLVVLDKAIQIARCFSARIELLLGDSTQVCTYANHCTRQGFDEVMLYSVFRGQEPLSDVTLRRVAEYCPDLVIKQSSGPHPLRRWTLKENDWHLVQECPVPVILAGPRPWNQPLRLAAACDVADRESNNVTRAILQSAGFLALGGQCDLDILYSEREQRDETLRMERAVRLAQLVREFHVGSERLRMVTGKPEDTLPGILAAEKYDLLVLGAVTHRTGIGAVLSNHTGTLADATDGDLLLVKAPVAAEDPVRSRARSRRDQLPHQCEQFV
jgi:nucleotide-binding universal stress UspA family protein